MLLNNLSTSTDPIALVYLARGAEADHLSRFAFFLRSYQRFSAGAEHSLFVIYKGFNSEEQLRAAHALFSVCNAISIHTTDAAFDIGAYAESLRQLRHRRVCFLNTNSEILCDGWLGKLAINLNQPRVGIVSATGSFESLELLDPRFPRFPNVHLRSNAFMMRREHATEILQSFDIADKKDAFFAESGPEGITRRIFAIGMTALVVGRNGRGYDPASWPISQTFRQGRQSNLLVHDNVTRSFEKMTWSEKKTMAQRSWGEYLQKDTMMVLPAE